MRSLKRQQLVRCENGVHRPHRGIVCEKTGVERAVCRICGVALVRTGATRHWYISGLLGQSPTAPGRASSACAPVDTSGEAQPRAIDRRRLRNAQ